jgi:hypothetical protein
MRRRGPWHGMHDSSDRTMNWASAASGSFHLLKKDLRVRDEGPGHGRLPRAALGPEPYQVSGALFNRLFER